MTSRRAHELGFTMVELLVTMMVFSIVAVSFYQVLFAQAQGADVATSLGRVSEEARVGFNRMVRDTREGDVISAASTTSYAVKVNFDGDGLYENPNERGDYEILTYAYDAGAKTITLNGEVLMRGVEPIPGEDPFTFSSNFLEYDWGEPYGTTSWQEINDASCAAHGITGVGDCDVPPVLDAAEFPYLTTVEYSLRVRDGENYTDFVASSQMRNRV